MSELILSFRSSSPSPSVILPLRSRIITPSTTRSSICIAALLQPSAPVSDRRALGAHDRSPSQTAPLSSAAPAWLPELLGALRAAHAAKEIDRAAYYANFNTVKDFGRIRARYTASGCFGAPPRSADRTTTYRTGMKMMFRKVDTNIPPATAVPTE